MTKELIKYTVEEVAGTDATVTYDTMKAEITVEVSYDGTAKILVTKSNRCS